VSITSNGQATGNIVGDGTSGGSNTIAFNDGNGVRVATFGGPPTTGNRVRSNSIFSNDGLGIDLNGDGRTLNDPKDPDTGANNLQNFPVLTSATTTSSGATTIQGVLNSAPNRTFLVQFFANPSGENEGKKFIGQRTVSTDAAGNVSFSFIPGQAVPVGQNVTATATSGSNTSEFSDPKLVTFPPQPS
jgi:titin